MQKRTFLIFRYDPEKGERAGFQKYELEVDEKLTTILDVLFRLQEQQDETLAFRCACRVGMCGSCAMVINGRERLACKTVVGDLPPGPITLRPLNHFPIVKDLVVDLSPLFDKYRVVMPYFEPKSEELELAVIPPDSEERRTIGQETECIACGACISSCTMMYWDPDYVGPAALTRAFTLLADSREALFKERLAKLVNEHGCYRCHTEVNCTEVCPKGLSPTRAILYIKKMAMKYGVLPLEKKEREEKREEEREVQVDLPPEKRREISRRRFLTRVAAGLAGALLAALAGILGSSSRGVASRTREWVKIGSIDDFPPGKVKGMVVDFEVRDGYFKSRVERSIIVSRRPEVGDLVVFNTRCTHLGCSVYWDDSKGLFVCPCHGGFFNPDGTVKSGPPPAPLERYQVKVKGKDLLVLMS